MSSELLDDLDYLDREIPKQIYAGFWRRLGAAILDSVALSFILMLWGGVTGVLGLMLPNVIILFLQDFCMVMIALLYLPLWESSSSQASIGKQILGMKVVDEHGERLSFWRALGRLVAKFLSYTILWIGFFMIAFTEKKQGLHDFIAHTYVIDR